VVFDPLPDPPSDPLPLDDDDVELPSVPDDDPEADEPLPLSAVHFFA
jgi:hypothetical protein